MRSCLLGLSSCVPHGKFVVLRGQTNSILISAELRCIILIYERLESAWLCKNWDVLKAMNLSKTIRMISICEPPRNISPSTSNVLMICNLHLRSIRVEMLFQKLICRIRVAAIQQMLSEWSIRVPCTLFIISHELYMFVPFSAYRSHAAQLGRGI